MLEACPAWLNLRGISVAALFAVALLPCPVRAEIVNGSFEDPDAGAAFVARSVGDNFGGHGWVVDQGTIDHIGGLWEAAEGEQSVDLNGSNAGGVAQDFATVAGQAYKIRFAMAGNPGGFDDKRMAVLWDGVQIADLVFEFDASHSVDNMGWTYFELTAVATDTSTSLAFHSLTGAMNGTLGFQPFYGPALDDVSVTLAPDAVPEPTSLALMGIGAVGLALRARIRGRRKSKVN